METLFPVEFAAQKVHHLDALYTSPFQVVKIDQFGDARKIGMGTPGYYSVGCVPKGPHIHRRYFSAHKHCGDPQQIIGSQPGGQVFKGAQETRVAKIGQTLVAG